METTKTGRATYSPEDNKLRLYIGRVPREEYLKLKAEGWQTLHKQRDAGGGDFAAIWTPSRRNTALEYADIIEDEDMGPEERAADRAERFGGYRDKRADEAGAEADRYEAGPTAHGYQSEAKAERAAARHDRIGDRAVDAWSKAEYWQRRTAGVIAHALYASRPDVRMGRIKTIEADLRRATPGGEWAAHLTLRLAYENQMLEAQGGRAAHVEMIPGGWLRGGRWMGNGERRILKVNKSPKTGRVVSVLVRDNHPSSVNHWGNPWPDGVAKVLCHTVETERLPVDAYRPPTEEELAAFLAEERAAKKARKAAAPAPTPLINPTDADAERLQAIWNERARLEQEDRKRRNGYAEEHKPSTVLRVTQAAYSAHSKGTYASAGTREVFAGGIECGSYYDASRKLREKHGAPVCMVRRTSGGSYQASRVIILTDKPQKPLPAAVWELRKVEQVTPELATA